MRHLLCVKCRISDGLVRFERIKGYELVLLLPLRFGFVLAEWKFDDVRKRLQIGPISGETLQCDCGFRAVSCECYDT